MNIIQIVILAIVQGVAELLPVSSSAHVIVAEKLLGLDPTAPEMTFLLVMLHTGTMFSVLFYFRKRWKLSAPFLRGIVVASACTGVLGLGLKKAIEKVMTVQGANRPEVERLFGNLPLIAGALLAAGLLIIVSDRLSRRNAGKAASAAGPDAKASAWIGIAQGLCLPFRGFSRSGATISTALVLGVPRAICEDFSFALAVVLTPPVVLIELKRLTKTVPASDLVSQVAPGALGMLFSFVAGLFALKLLSSWLENGRWRFFGYYCLVAATCVGTLAALGF